MKISNKDMMNKSEKEIKKNKYINALTNQFKKK